MNIREIIKKHYGFRDYPKFVNHYNCPRIEMTEVYIGYGLNLTKTRIPKEFFDELLSMEITKIWRHLRATYPWWEDLDHDTQTKLMFIVYDSYCYDIDPEIVESIENGDTTVVDEIFNQILEGGQDNGSI